MAAGSSFVMAQKQGTRAASEFRIITKNRNFNKDDLNFQEFSLYLGVKNNIEIKKTFLGFYDI